MKVGIIGTGMVGQFMGAKLLELGHDVMFGTRDVEKTMSRTEADGYGNPPFSAWRKEHDSVKLGTFKDAAAHGEIVINATKGLVSVNALRSAGEENLNGKILVDIANALDSSGASLPTLAVCNTESLGERIQEAFPQARVVKTLNTMNAVVMTNPDSLKGDHNVFISGNDADAKSQVAAYLKDWFGWKEKNIIDLGDITTARGTEMLLPIWIRLYGAFQSTSFNFHIVRG
jgi:predicted dinucleotide-binding enzyme